MKKIFLIFFIFFINYPLISNAKNKETYEYLDLFGKVFDRVKTEYVEEVTDEELIEKPTERLSPL